jgi:mevalonate kinase
LTRIAVGDVRYLVESHPDRYEPTLSQIGHLVEIACEVLASGDIETLGALMDKNHTLLQELTVSSPELDRLVEVACDAGAYGAKLSGGGRGGNMIALVDPKRTDSVKQALLQAGAVRVFVSTIG